MTTKLNKQINKHRLNYKSMFVDYNWENELITWKDWIDNVIRIGIDNKLTDAIRVTNNRIRIRDFYFVVKNIPQYKTEFDLLPTSYKTVYYMFYDYSKNKRQIDESVYNYVESLI